MKIIDVNGIVLSETNYSESSKILNVLTDELGLIGVLLNGHLLLSIVQPGRILRTRR